MSREVKKPPLKEFQNSIINAEVKFSKKVKAISPIEKTLIEKMITLFREWHFFYYKRKRLGSRCVYLRG